MHRSRRFSPRPTPSRPGRRCRASACERRVAAMTDARTRLIAVLVRLAPDLAAQVWTVPDLGELPADVEGTILDVPARRVSESSSRGLPSAEVIEVCTASLYRGWPRTAPTTSPAEWAFRPAHPRTEGTKKVMAPKHVLVVDGGGPSEAPGAFELLRDQAPKNGSAGPLIRAWRQRVGLSQEELAAAISVTFSTVSRWENGRVMPSKLAW